METRPYDRIAAELAALRRVAAVVARGALPEQVFAAVAAEAGLLLGADLTTVARYDPGGVVVILGAWSCAGAAKLRTTGTRTALAGHNMSALVFQTGRAVRIDDYAQATGEAADLGRELGFRRAVGVPITVEGQLWGVMTVASTSEEPLPAGTEVRLAGFTELAGTAIANAQARVELRGYAEEQAALRRVAMLVARGAAPEEVFAAVAAEAGRLPGTDLTTVSRYDPDGLAVLSAWTSTGAAIPLLSAGTRIPLGGKNVGTLVFQTRQPVRIDDYGWNATGAAAFIGRDWGYRAAAGAPITVEGQLWGIMTVASTSEETLPADTEAQLVAFTELVGTAIANAEARVALAASRARIVTAADEARRRIERDLHDGAQQRLVTLAMEVRELQEALPSRAGELTSRLAGVSAGLEAALAELREIARGIHPAALAQGGLRPALRGLVRRCPVPVDLHIQVAGRPPQSVEIAAYYVVSEALANTAKHADASAAEVEVVAGDGILRVRVHDNGRGGADLGRGSGLIGLRDRAEALGGRISLHSPPGTGTTLKVDIPLDRSNALPPAVLRAAGLWCAFLGPHRHGKRSGAAQFGKIRLAAPVPQRHQGEQADAPFGQVEYKGHVVRDPAGVAAEYANSVEAEQYDRRDPRFIPAAFDLPGHPEPYGGGYQPADDGHHNGRAVDGALPLKRRPHWGQGAYPSDSDPADSEQAAQVYEPHRVDDGLRGDHPAGRHGRRRLGCGACRHRRRLGCRLVVGDRPCRLVGHFGRRQLRHVRHIGVFQAELEDLGDLRPVVRLLREARLDQGANPRRAAGQVRGLVEHAVVHRSRVPTTEGSFADHGIGGQRAEGEYVDHRGHRQVLELFRRHELRSSHRLAGAGQRRGLQRAGDAEVDHSRAVGPEQHVGRFEIAMHDVGGVNGLQRLGDAGDQPERHRLGQRPAGVQDLLQGRSLHVGGGQPRRIGVRVRVDQFGGIQPAYAPGGLDLLLEARAEFLVVAEFRPHHLQCEGAAGRGGRQVYLAHPAGAEAAAQAILPDLYGIIARQWLHASAPCLFLPTALRRSHYL